MSTHTITAEIEVQFRIPDMPMDEHETAYPKVEITYTYHRGSPATGPTWNSGGEPADPDELQFISAKLIDGDGLDPEPSRLKDWAEEWLYDEGYEQACRNAEEDNRPDPDAAYEAMRDGD